MPKSMNYAILEAIQGEMQRDELLTLLYEYQGTAARWRSGSIDLAAYLLEEGRVATIPGLAFGADDLDGTIIEEKITNSAGGLSGGAMTRNELRNLIKMAGKVPVERDSFYRPVK